VPLERVRFLDTDTSRVPDGGPTVATRATLVGGNAVLAPDQPDIKGIGLSFTGEYLYWKAEGVHNTFAYVNNNLPLSPLGLGEAKDVNTDWSSGFRLGLAYKLPYDGWEIGADYTFYRADGENSVKNDPTVNPFSGITPAFTPALLGGPGFWTVAAKEDFSFDRFNVEIGRKSKLSDTLSVRFFGGPSVVWLDVDAKVKALPYGSTPPFSNGLGYYYKTNMESTLYGVRAGADGEMKLKQGFSFVGKAAGSLLIGDLDVSEKYGYDADGNGAVGPGEAFGDTKHTFSHIVPAIELEAGVAWEKKLLDGLNFKVFAGYQFSQYFNALERIDAPYWPVNYGPAAADRAMNLGLHGLVFRLKLDF
jgi:hypothetical protein